MSFVPPDPLVLASPVAPKAYPGDLKWVWIPARLLRQVPTTTYQHSMLGPSGHHQLRQLYLAQSDGVLSFNHQL